MFSCIANDEYTYVCLLKYIYIKSDLPQVYS